MRLQDATPCYLYLEKTRIHAEKCSLRMHIFLLDLDDNVVDDWASVRSVYGIGENDVRGIDNARHSHFVKAKRDLDVLPPTHDAELHFIRANYQAKIWLQADHVLLDLENKPTETIDLWQDGTD